LLDGLGRAGAGASLFSAAFLGLQRYRSAEATAPPKSNTMNSSGTNSRNYSSTWSTTNSNSEQ
jgi:hypothetical protein